MVKGNNTYTCSFFLSKLQAHLKQINEKNNQNRLQITQEKMCFNSFLNWVTHDAWRKLCGSLFQSIGAAAEKPLLAETRRVLSILKKSSVRDRAKPTPARHISEKKFLNVYMGEHSEWNI